MINHLIPFLCLISTFFLSCDGNSEVGTDNIDTKIVAHRGAWKTNKLPQNSIASLKNSIKIGADASEFDLHLTKDGIIVCNHDHDFNGIDIEESEYSDLLQYKLSNGETIPVFSEILGVGAEHNELILFVELKPSRISKERSMLLAQKVVEEIKKANIGDRVIYISFDYDILKTVIKLDSQAKTMYLKGDFSPQKLKSDKIWGADYRYKKYQKNPDWLIQAKKLGIKLNAWTVNDTSTMKILLKQGFDFITTDEPELLSKIIQNNTYVEDWELIWNDEFNGFGLPDSSKWSYDIGGHGWGNNEKQFYTKADSQNIKIENGHLIITARLHKKGDNAYTSARISTKHKGDWKYGKIEVRAKLPKGKGLWPAIWMLPSEFAYGNWPRSGEIDIMEFVGYCPDSIFQTVHTKSFNHIIGTQVGKSFKISNLSEEFHTYSIVWDKEKIQFFIDDIETLQFQNRNKSFAEWPFDQTFHLILNLAVGGNWGGKYGIDKKVFPAHYEIDYVRVFKPKS